MRIGALRWVVLLALGSAPGAVAGLLYDNTTVDTGDTLLYSAGGYTGIGDQIHLVAPGDAVSALLQVFNAGAAGTFDIALRFYQVGSPVGAQVGGTFTLTDVPTVGLDVINLQFDLGGLPVPQDLIFVASLTNETSGVDVGLDFFEPPGVGSSDNTFLIVDFGGFAQASSANENVFFQLSDAPEPATLGLLVAGIGLGWIRTLRRDRARPGIHFLDFRR